MKNIFFILLLLLPIYIQAQSVTKTNHDSLEVKKDISYPKDTISNDSTSHHVAKEALEGIENKSEVETKAIEKAKPVQGIHRSIFSRTSEDIIREEAERKKNEENAIAAQQKLMHEVMASDTIKRVSPKRKNIFSRTSEEIARENEEKERLEKEASRINLHRKDRVKSYKERRENP